MAELAGIAHRDAAIEVQQLTREFRKGPRAVDHIDLSVSAGEIYGFLGPNGAGKSTTVLMLTTLLPPTSGSATVDGFDIVRQGAQVRSVIGAALQEAALDAVLTGREHLQLQATLQGMPAAERRSRAGELLERVGLTEAADRRVGGYSGGMKRRLDLALALVHRPRILFLDEPTTGLDLQSRTALWEEVGRLAHDEGMTVFLTTQYLEEADALADRVGIIDHGRIVVEGTPARASRCGGCRRSGRPAGPLRDSGAQRPQQRHRAAARRRGAARRDRSRARPSQPKGGFAAAAPTLARRRLPGKDGPQARGRRRAG
jgi:ABC-2 type transport system ATP-binding protein